MDEWTPLTAEQYIARVLQDEKPQKSATFDAVSKPRHYMLFEEEGIEVRDVIEKLVSKFEMSSMGHSYMFVSDYVQMMQYLMRFMEKNGKEDLEKALWYLDKMIRSY